VSRAECRDVGDTQDAIVQAADWLLRIQERELSPEQLAEWLHWMEQDERHARAFDDVVRAWHGTASIESPTEPTLPWPTAAELAADAYDGSASVTTWIDQNKVGASEDPHVAKVDPTSPNRASRRRRFAPLAVAASLAGLGFITWVVRDARLDAPTASTQIVETGFDEHRSIALDDGSRLEVGSQSLILVSMTPSHRNLTLERGEAFFTVAKDPRRPFTVKAGHANVTAIGTAFNVRHTGQRVVVAVAEGVVQLASIPAARTRGAVDGIERNQDAAPDFSSRLRAGQRAVLEDQQLPPRLSQVDAREIDGWRSGRLQYENEPLSSVVEDLGRYSGRRMTFGDTAARDLRITGTVFKTRVDSWLNSLPKALPVRTRQLPDGTVVIESVDRTLN
jgi:transmembrane sensor